MIAFDVMLRSRGNRIAHGLIRKSYHIEAKDDVDAAMAAKEKARKEFPDRDCSSWFADQVVIAKRKDGAT